jgi:Family of unknown function (DUF6459)
MRTPPPQLPAHAIEPSARPAAAPLLPPFPRQPARRRRRPLPDAVAVRRIPLPESAPPYDDESRATAAEPRESPGETSRADSPAWPPAATRRTRPALSGRPVPEPDADEWRGQFAQALAETLAGSRAPRQLAPWTTEQARKRISQLGPVLRAGQRPRVRRVLTSAPDSGVVEMTVIIGVGQRVHALAVRLERTPPGRGHPDAGQQWRCTAIEAA